MYVIFPLDELLDLNSAKENKRGRATLDNQSHTRHTEKVLPLSQPNQQLPNQLNPPLNNKPKTPQQQPTPTKQPLQPTPPVQQPTPTKQPLQPTPPVQQPTKQPLQPTSPVQQSTLTKQQKQPTPPQHQPTPPKQQIQPTPPQHQPTPPKQLKQPTPPHQSTPPKQLKQPTPPQQQQQQQQPQQQQPQQQPSPQKPPLSKASSKSSVAFSPSVVVVPQSPVSVPSSNQQATAVKKPPTQQQTVQQPPPDQLVTKRQRSSQSTSTETSSTSSTGAKGKGLLTSVSSGGAAAAATSRSSWAGGPVVSAFQESCPGRSGSYTASFQDVAVLSEGNTLKVVTDQSRAGSIQDIRGSTLSVRPPLTKSNSFRSHLSDSYAVRPKQVSVEAIKKSQSTPSSPAHSPTHQSQSIETPRKPLGPAEKTPTPPLQELKVPEVVLVKEKHSPGAEGVKIKQEVPVQAPPPSPSHQQLTAAESLRIQQECLPNPKHLSGRSNRSSGSQKLSDLPPSGSGGGSRIAAAGSANSSKNQGLQQRNTVMASNEGFRDLTNPAVNESLKAHNAFTFKLVKTGRRTSH